MASVRGDDKGAPTVHVGIVGLGGGASDMIPAFVQHPHIALTAAADIDKGQLEKFHSEFHAETYQRAEDLCAHPQVDVVYIATPNQYHTAHALLALEQGKHVLVEKPMTLTLEDADVMIAAAARHGVQLLVNVKHSFDPYIVKIREIVQRGELGQLRMLHYWYFSDWLYRPRTAEELNPSLGGCVLDTFFRLGWFGPHKRLWPHNTIHFGEVHYVLKATPQRFSPGLVSAATSDKTAELCNPAHSLVKRRGLLRRCRTMMDGTIQRLPFVEFQQHAARHLRHRPRQHRGIKNPPGNDTIQRQAALQALAACQLAFFHTTTTFQNAVPDFNAPATRVPLDTLDGVVDRLDRHGRQQQPLNGLDVRWRIDFLDLDCPQRDRGQAFTLAMAGGTQRQGTKPQRQRGVTGGLRATTRHLQEEVVANRLRFNRGPHIVLGPTDATVPRGANQQIDARWACGCQHVIDISFPIAHAHQASRGAAVTGGEHGVETVEPLLTFLLADGQLLAPGALAHLGGITGPDLLGQQPQGHTLGREGQRRMDQKPLTGHMAQGPQTLGSRVPGPVDFGRILHGVI